MPKRHEADFPSGGKTSRTRRLGASLAALCLCVTGLACRQEADNPPPSPAAALPPAPVAAPVAPAAISDEEVIRRFHLLWYNSGVVFRTKWMGILTEQSPMDTWILQELMFQTKPDFIVECGAFHGGSAALWAMILKEINPAGRVISIDIEDRVAEARKLPIVKERVEFIIGSSTDPKVVADVKKKVAGKKVMLVLDSDHRKHHVLNELNAYWDIVPIGGYINVQDTNINGHPALPNWGEGPMEAVREFIAQNGRFQIDTSQERLMHTLHPNGYLQRVK